MATSLEGKIFTGAGWILGWRMATRGLGLISTLVLVRLLLPADFGLIALAMGFTQVIESMSFLGVEDALVREHKPSRSLYDTGFTLNLLRALATAAALAALAQPMAEWFVEPRLTTVLYALSAGAAINGLGNVGLVEFRREFAFQREFVSMILPRVVSIVLMIGTAVIWRSYWALVVGILAMRFSWVALSYRMHPYRPRLSLSAWGELVGYSLWSWVVAVAVMVRERSTALMIGPVLGTGQVGMYSVGADLAALPTSELVEPLSRAAFSGFSTARNADTPVAEVYQRVVATMALLTLPAGIGTSLIADPLVRLAYGPNWVAAIPLVQVLAITGAATVFGYIGWTLFSAYGLLRTIFAVTVTAAATRILLLVVLLPWIGVVGAAVAVTASVFVEDVLYIGLTFRRFGGRAVGLLAQVWRGLLAVACMAVALVQAGLGWTPASGGPAALAMQLAAAVALGGVVYVGVLLLAWIASGRPPGAEADGIAILARSVHKLRGSVQRMGGIIPH
jgi:lipopolysaccharide exporter